MLKKKMLLPATEDREEIQEVSVSLAAAIEISLDAALSCDHFHFKEQRTAQKAFLGSWLLKLRPASPLTTGAGTRVWCHLELLRRG